MELYSPSKFKLSVLTLYYKRKKFKRMVAKIMEINLTVDTSWMYDKDDKKLFHREENCSYISYTHLTFYSSNISLKYSIHLFKTYSKIGYFSGFQFSAIEELIFIRNICITLCVHAYNILSYHIYEWFNIYLPMQHTVRNHKTFTSERMYIVNNTIIAILCYLWLSFDFNGNLVPKSI